MKKRYTLVATLVSLFALTACSLGRPLHNKSETQVDQEVVDKKAETKTKKKPVATKEAEKKAPEVDYSPYQTVLTTYKESLDLPLLSLDRDKVSSYLAWLSQYDYLYTDAVYYQGDVTGDGREELVVALEAKGSQPYTIIDLYTISEAGDLVRLTDVFRKTGPEIGEKVTLWPLGNGSLSLESAGHFRLYRLNSSGTELVLESESETNPKPESAVDMTLWDWKSLRGETHSATSSATGSEAMNLNEILSGNFSSVAGTWRNGQGEVLVFDQHGLVHEIYILEGVVENARVENGIYSAGLDLKDGYGGFSIYLVSAGSGFDDTSDIGRDRIVLRSGTGPLGFPDDEYYYRVD